MPAQASLCLAWSETPEDTFCRVVAQLFKAATESCIVLVHVVVIDDLNWIFSGHVTLFPCILTASHTY